ncbi:MAG: efflux RND transporter periplasmic adaptor subunit [Pseudomonadota bacterium]
MKRLPILVAIIVLAGLSLVALFAGRQFFDVQAAVGDGKIAAVVDPGAGSVYRPTEAQWRALELAASEGYAFRSDFTTEGKIAVNDETSTPVFSPFAGRTSKIFAKPGDMIEKGQPLFVLEAADTVQSLNDYVAASSAFNTARSKLKLAETIEKRANDLYAGKAVPLKDWQQAQADLATAQNDERSSETAIEAARNKLRILGLSEQAINLFAEKRQINPDTTIVAPISGTVVQRKLGPGQYVATGASDPAFVIGDLRTVWLVAFVRETDALQVQLGQDVTFKVLAAPNRVFRARIDYVASAFDPVTRRLLVRGTIDNPDGVLRPEMFASATLFDGGERRLSPTIPSGAIIYTGDEPRIWVARDDHTLEMRKLRLGLTDGDRVQVLEGLKIGERVVVKGSIFIDRAANAY